MKAVTSQKTGRDVTRRQCFVVAVKVASLFLKSFHLVLLHCKSIDSNHIERFSQWTNAAEHWIPAPTMHLSSLSLLQLQVPLLTLCPPPAAAPLTTTNWPLSGCWTRRVTARRSQWSVVLDSACWRMEPPTNRPSSTRTSPTSLSAQVSPPPTLHWGAELQLLSSTNLLFCPPYFLLPLFSSFHPKPVSWY